MEVGEDGYGMVWWHFTTLVLLLNTSLSTNLCGLMDGHCMCVLVGSMRVFIC